jgi:hypothetical protein
MSQEQIDRSERGMLERAEREFRNGLVGIVETADRFLSIFAWADERKEMAQRRFPRH